MGTKYFLDKLNTICALTQIYGVGHEVGPSNPSQPTVMGQEWSSRGPDINEPSSQSTRINKKWNDLFTDKPQKDFDVVKKQWSQKCKLTRKKVTPVDSTKSKNEESFKPVLQNITSVKKEHLTSSDVEAEVRSMSKEKKIDLSIFNNIHLNNIPYASTPSHSIKLKIIKRDGVSTVVNNKESSTFPKVDKRNDVSEGFEKGSATQKENYKINCKKSKAINPGKESKVNRNKYQCYFCANLFDTSHDLKMHKAVHEEIWFCKVCSKRFISRELLNKHSSVHRKIEVKNVFQCHLCLRKFNSSPNWVKHISKSKCKKVYPCDQCDTITKHAHTLRRHKITKHRKEKPYKCESCSIGFNRSEALKIHTVKEHTELKPYFCDHCPKSYYYAHSLRNHEKKAHPVVKKTSAKLLNNKSTLKTSTPTT